MSKKLSKTKNSQLDSVKQSSQVKSDPAKDSKAEFTSKADSKSKIGSKSNTKSKSADRKTVSKNKPSSKIDSKSKVESKSISKSKLDPKAKSKSKSTKPKTDSKVGADSKANSKSKSKAKTDSQIGADSKADSKSKVESKSISKSKLDPKAKPKSKSKTKTDSQIGADSKADSKSKSKAKTDSQIGADSKADSKSKSKAKTDSQIGADSKADSKSKPKPKTDPKTKAASKADSKSKSKPKTVSKSKADSKADNSANKPGSSSQVSMKKSKSKEEVELKKTKPGSKTRKKSRSKSSSVPSVTTSLTMTSGSSGSVSKNGSKAKMKVGSKTGSKTGSKAGSKSVSKIDSKTGKKPQTKSKSKSKPKGKSEPKPKSKSGAGEIMKINEKNALQAYQDLQKDPKCKSLLKKHLTKELFDKLMKKKTKMGSSLLDCVQTGLANHDSDIGVYAPDPDAYNAFADLFNPIIEDYHGFKKTDKHPKPDFGKLDKFIDLDKNKEFIISTRIRCGRSLKGMPFNPCIKKEHYQELEKKISGVLAKIPDDELKGTYTPLTKMSKKEQKKLIDQHYLFKEGDKFLQAGNACRFWPTGRGIFLNKDKTFMVWVGEEDHIRVISMQDGANVKDIYNRLIKGIKYLESKCEFVRDSRLGYLTFCPTNLGTTLRASVMIKLPKLGKKVEELEATAEKMKLQVRGSAGEHTESPDGIYDVSNKRRLGLTEGQAVMEMQEGVLKLIEMEKKKK